ncbi:MAG: bifunctional metallophosphatase/5'-nucleotidase [Salibacteraceae bacterium]
MTRLRFPSLLLLGLLTWASCGSPTESATTTQSADNPNTRVDFIVLQLNDVYEISPLEGGKVGGLARVATLRKQLLEENPNVITILSGDFLSPSLTATLKDENGEAFAGKQMIEVLNALELDYVTFGNHEFDNKTIEPLQKRLNESEFTWTSINCFNRIPNGAIPFKKVLADGSEERVPGSVLHSITSSKGRTIQVGFIGVTLPFSQQDYVMYSDEVLAVRSEFERIQDQCHVMLGITHLSIEGDRELAQKVPGFALLMGGHEHDHHQEWVGNTAITKADANAKSVYVHRISHQLSNGHTKVESELVNITDAMASEPGVQAVVNKWENITNERLVAMGYQPDEVLTTLDQPLDGRESSIRNQQTDLGNYIAKAMMAAYPESDLALLNSGSVRVDDQLMGDITQYDVLRTLPFGGGVVLAELSGQQLLQTLEIGLKNNKGTGGYLQLGGIRSARGVWYLGESEIDPAAQYRVAMTGYMKSGGESNLEYLEQVSATQADPLPGYEATRNDIRDAFMAYLRNLEAS